jgi:invasion protein IalB
MFALQRSIKNRSLRKHAVRGVLLAAVLLLPKSVAAQLRGSVSDEGAEKSALFPVPSFQIKPVAGAPAAPGVRRVIQTFGDWTLICDEAKRGRVCNASQSIVAEDGTLAFSWSMAATAGGEPVFLLRAPVASFPAHTVTLAFGNTETVIRLETCDARMCIGFLPLNTDIFRHIKVRGRVAIRYRTADGMEPVAFVSSLDGLGTAISSIR